MVAAIGKCSRPEQLKAFLYLDFIDRDKRDNVLKKLVNTISMCHHHTVYSDGVMYSHCDQHR